MNIRKIDFDKIDWELPLPGLKTKVFQENGKQVRLLELSKELEHPEWCETGHIGYVVEGEIEIIFDDESTKYKKGDSLYILSGKEERHIPKPLTEKVILFMVEEI